MGWTDWSVRIILTLAGKAVENRCRRKTAGRTGGEKMQSMPKDPIMLLSYVNTQLRDFYPPLKELCASMGVDQKELVSRLSAVDYQYDQSRNQFV